MDQVSTGADSDLNTTGVCGAGAGIETALVIGGGALNAVSAGAEWSLSSSCSPSPMTSADLKSLLIGTKPNMIFRTHGDLNHRSGDNLPAKVLCGSHTPPSQILRGFGGCA